MSEKPSCVVSYCEECPLLVSGPLGCCHPNAEDSEVGDSEEELSEACENESVPIWCPLLNGPLVIQYEKS